MNQYLRFDWDEPEAGSSNVTAVYTQDDDDNVGDFLKFEEGDGAFQFELEFEEGFESDVDSDDDGLDDLEDETLHVLGEDFAVSRASLEGTQLHDLRLELMGGAVHDTLEEGETRTYTIDGKDYEVTVLIITDATPFRTKFKVNGQVTKELEAGETDVLSDGTTLGIRELLPNEAGETAGGDLAEFYLGANKIVIEGEDEVEANVEINEENIEDVYAELSFTNEGNNTVKLHKIEWRLDTDGVGGDEPFVAPGQGLREWLDEPEGMWSSSWDIAYEGLTDPGHSVFEIKARGDDEYKLSFENMQGIEYSIPLFHAGAVDAIWMGDDDDALVMLQGTNTSEHTEYSIDKNDYFIVGHNAGTDTGVTRVLRLDSIDISDDQVQLTDVGTGGQVTAVYEAGTAINGCEEQGAGDFNIAGYTFLFEACYNSTASGDAKYNLIVDLDDSGAVGVQVPGIVLNGGGIFNCTEFSSQSTTAPRTDIETSGDDEIDCTIWTDADNFDEAPSVNEELNITISVANGATDLDIDTVEATSCNPGYDPKSHEDNDDLTSGMTNYGVYAEEMNEDNDPDSLTVHYPLEQVLPQAFVVFEGAVVSEGGAAGTVTYEVPNRIEIGAALLASQVSDVTAANVLSVGGSCVNEVTAELLGLPYPSCGEASGLMEGEGVIKLVDNGDNVAVIVAGWDAEDTTRATRVLSDWETWQDANKLVGEEVTVTGTSLTNYDVTPVTADAEPADDDAADEE